MIMTMLVYYHSIITLLMIMIDFTQGFTCILTQPAAPWVQLGIQCLCSALEVNWHFSSYQSSLYTSGFTSFPKRNYYYRLSYSHP